jgi:predicted transglutaminase-like cysteine proteinase
MKKIDLWLGIAALLGGLLFAGCQKKEEALDPRKPDTAVIETIEADPVEKEFTYPLGFYTTRTATIRMTLDGNLYAYYRSLPRYLLYENYVCYMNEEKNRELVAEWARQMKENAIDQEISDHQLIQQMIVFVQNLEYVHDVDSTGEIEWPKYPIETFYDGGGDCEDLSILLAGGLRELGYRVAFILFNDHVGVGIQDDGQMSGVYYEYEGVRYFYIETTAKGWDIGGVPEEYYCLSAKLILVKE